MKVRKRNGEIVAFEREKIINTLTKANNEVREPYKIANEVIYDIVEKVESYCNANIPIETFTIQNIVESELFEKGSYQFYNVYSKHKNSDETELEKKILNLIDGTNDELNKENSNKNATLASTQRDYMAGEISKQLVRKYIFPKDVMNAHDRGIIHIHDLDYAANHITNCCLVNLEDILKNGTVMTGTKIFPPKSFAVAATIASQIVMSVSASQYGFQ